MPVQARKNIRNPSTQKTGKMTEKKNKWQALKHFFTGSSEKTETEPEPSPEEEPAPEPPDWKQQVLADFSDWLEALPDDAPPAASATVENCDLYTLLTEFTALRQEIRFQNQEQNRTTDSFAGMQAAYEKSLSLFENSARGIETLAADIRQDAETRIITPFLDIRDALISGHAACINAMGKKRWFRRSAKRMGPVAEGYETAIRRLDRALSHAGVTPVKAEGRLFDPKQMKAVGTQSDKETGAGIVVSEETGGFLRNGEVLRLAEVIVNEPAEAPK